MLQIISDDWLCHAPAVRIASYRIGMDALNTHPANNKEHGQRMDANSRRPTGRVVSTLVSLKGNQYIFGLMPPGPQIWRDVSGFSIARAEPQIVWHGANDCELYIPSGVLATHPPSPLIRPSP